MPTGRTVAVVLDDPATRSAHEESTDAWWLYATEVLDHLRLPYRVLARLDAHTSLEDVGVLVFVRRPELDPASRHRVERLVDDGASLIVVGHPGDLTELLGVQATAEVARGHVDVHAADAWTLRPDVALHAVGGVRLRARSDVAVLASWRDAELIAGTSTENGDQPSPAVTRRRAGRGLAWMCAPDLWQSIVRIQQGYPVHADGAPAPDGTAPIDDGILKCEDGMALCFSDRALPPGEPELTEPFEHVYPPPSAVPIFHRPHADWWRSLFVQLLWSAAEAAGVPLPWLHYWPAGVPAVAHLSHDSDQNVDEHGRAALETFAEAGVRVTWCQVFPGGYAPEIYAAIDRAGHEQALHYNAMHDADIARWGWPEIRAQYAWAQAATGTEDIVSNKNHYTRWEGWTEFYRWCERLGIQIDQSRGPSKQGTVGFPFGTAHVSFPISGTDEGNRFLDVLNLPLHTQDLAWAGHESNRDVILDAAYEQHGVAHFLFHGPHLHRRPATRRACLAVVQEARRRGMPWWTSGEINRWERLRRRVTLSVRPDPEHHGGWVVRTRASRPVPNAAVLLLLPGRTGVPQLRRGDGSVTTVVRHGREFVELTTDIPLGDTTWTLQM